MPEADLDYSLLFHTLDDAGREELREAIAAMRRTCQVLHASGMHPSLVATACLCATLEWHAFGTPAPMRDCVAFNFVETVAAVAHQWCHLPEIRKG